MPSPLTPDRVAFASHIGKPLEGRSLVDFLSTRFKYFSPTEWRQKIELGEVHLNKTQSSADAVLAQGDLVEYFAIRVPEPKVPSRISIIYQDEDLLVVNKPAHIPVHPSGRYLRNTLIHVLQKQTGLNFLVLSHRLDRETSGLLVLCKTPLAKDKMYWAFFDGEVEKTYWALVWGRPEPASGVIDVPIGEAGSTGLSKIRIKQVPHGTQAKTARTKYHTLGTRWIQAPEWTPPPWPSLEKLKRGPRGPWPISLVECKPLTGRTNQIRVHLTQTKCGIVGDKLYDPSEEVFMAFKDTPPVLEDSPKSKGYCSIPPGLERRLVLDAHALHARKLTFRHPRTRRPLTLEAPPPTIWQQLYDRP
jgi:23S rRNA pseudouridine1911/1915/1917 synthase